MTACADCPCPESCRMIPAYCGWAAEDPPDPLRLRHIRDASARTPRREPRTFPPTAADTPPRPPVPEVLALIAAVKACPFRLAGCGCSGAACALKGGAYVGHSQCFDCIRAYGP